MSKFLKGFWNYTNLSNNTTLKIVSVALSVMLWFYVMGDINPELTTTIDNIGVELLNIEELSQSGLEMIGQKDYVVQVEVKGRRNDVYKVTSENIKINADVMGFKSGINSVPLEISVPTGVKLMDFTPKQIKIELDRIVQKQKPVEIIRTNRHLDGFMTNAPTFEIEEVLVAGPESFVNNVEKVIGEIDVGGLTESVSQNVPLRAVDAEGNEVVGVSIGQAYAKVYLNVYRFASIPVVADITGEVDENYRVVSVSVIPETIRLQGDTNAIEVEESIKTEAIDVTGLTESIELEVPILITEGLTASYQNRLVRVIVNVEPIKIKEIILNSDSIVIENLGTGLITNLPEIDKDIIIKIRDLESILETVSHLDIAMSANLEGLEVGVHEVIIDSKANEFIGFEVIPKTIEIEIMDESNTGDEE
jgi:YbbR domain-containing protein